MRVGKYNIARVDERNIAIHDIVRHKETNEEYLANVKYYTTWESALTRLLDLHVTASEVKTILKEIKDAKEEIIRELKVLQKSHKI